MCVGVCLGGRAGVCVGGRARVCVGSRARVCGGVGQGCGCRRPHC